MTLVSGLITRTNFEKLTDLSHTKHYRAQARNPSDRHMFGYDVVKLDQDVTWYAGWRLDALSEFSAKAGQYLVQCHNHPPQRIESWVELKKQFHVFRNSKKKSESR